MSGVPPVTVPSIAFGNHQRRTNNTTTSEQSSSSHDRLSATSGLWAHAADKYQSQSLPRQSNSQLPKTANQQQQDLTRLESSCGGPSTTHPPVGSSWTRRVTRPTVRGPPIPELEKVDHGNTFSSQLNHFVTIHPVFQPSHTSPHFGTPATQSQKGGDTPYSAHGGEIGTDAFAKALRGKQAAATGSGTENPGKEVRVAPTPLPSSADTLRTRATGADIAAASGDSLNPNAAKQRKGGGYTAAFRDDVCMSDETLTSSHDEESLSKLRENVLWRRWFIRIGSAHAVAPEFAEALVVPSLQFGDRLLEAFFSLEFYRKRIRWRVIAMCAFGILLILFQLWMGFANANRLRRLANDTARSTEPPSNYILEDSNHLLLDSPPRPKQFSEIFASAIQRRLWSSMTEGVDNANELSFYALACVDQAVVDGISLVLWALIGFSARLEIRMEAINVIVQLFRTTLLIFFAQGVYSPCAIKQGAVDIVMNNLAVASANTTIFNCLGLARVRRACFISIAWLAGAIELCIVMARSPTVNYDDLPQLSLFIVSLTAVPLFVIVYRYRSEVSERESLFYAVMLEHTKVVNSNLQAHLTEMEAVQGLDIEKALPEGVVPSQIVHVAVMELKQAEKTAELIQSTLPSLMTGAPASGIDVTPLSKDTADPHSSYKRDSQRGAHHFFFRHGQTNAGLTPANRRESSHSVWTGLGGLAVMRHSNSQHLGVVMEASVEIKARILNALKLLSRSHDLYAAQPQDPYQGAIIFHALGHDGSQYNRGYQISSSASRMQSTKTNTTSIAPPLAISVSALQRGSSSSFVIGDALSQMQQLPFLSGLGEMARNVGQNWTFDMLRVARITKDHAMLTTAMLLASPIIDKLNWVFDINKFYTFIRVIENEYSPTDRVPYHNRTHAAIHAHTMSVLLTWFQHAEQSTTLESLAVLVASLCHDVGHPGRTNAYLVNANRRLAIIYNDISVLENLHASKTFETLQHRESRFLAGAENDDYRFFRKLVIDLILATDMKLHFELINSYKLRRGCGDFNPFDESNRVLTLKLLMKAADLSHGALDWPLHQQQSMAVNEEFWAQGDAEEKLGLPKSPLCDRAKAHEMSKQQVSFLEFIVTPLYNEITAVDPSGNVASTCEVLIKANIAKWKVIAASQSTVPVDTYTAEKSRPSPERDRASNDATRDDGDRDNAPGTPLYRRTSNRSVTYNIDIKMTDDGDCDKRSPLSDTSRHSRTASPTSDSWTSRISPTSTDSPIIRASPTVSNRQEPRLSSTRQESQRSVKETVAAIERQSARSTT